MRIIPCDQGTGAWFAARAGKVTASKVADAVAFLKRGEKQGQETAARAAYKARIVAETLKGEPLMDGFVSECMIHGTEQEPFARAAYEVKFDASVETVGFVMHPSIDRAGASPDGLIGKDGGLEIKAPKTETHLGYMLAGVLPAEYEAQVMWNLACTEREWWDFVSFDPRLPARHQLFTRRVFRDEQRIADLENGVRRFLAEVDELIAELERLNPEQAPAEKLREQMDASLGLTDDDAPAWWFDDNAPEHAVKL